MTDTQPVGRDDDPPADLVTYAWGLDPPIASWSNQRGVQTLLGWDGAEFLTRLRDVVVDPDIHHLWYLVGFEWDRWHRSRKAYDLLNLQACGHTNWEMFVFEEHPEVWERTVWWNCVDGVDQQVPNPLASNDG